MNTRYAYLGLVIALGGCLLLSLCSQAMAQDEPTCALFTDMRKALAKQYDEHPTKVGKVPLKPAFVVLFESAHGTATIVLVMDGIACEAGSVGNWKPWHERPPWREAQKPSPVERMGDAIKPRGQ